MNTKRGIIGLGLLAAGITPMWAQDIKGVVIDQKSKETLIGAEAITAPYEVLKQVFANPNIDKAVTDFNNDWYAVYGEGKGICDL